MERQGGLRLCKCEHPLAQHQPRPLYFGAAETEAGCYFCECSGYQEGEFQGLRCLSKEEYSAYRKASGLPEMRYGKGE